MNHKILKHNDDDILEDALNKGVKATALKHDISGQTVYDIVMRFKEDIEDLCPCKLAAKKGEVVMCFFCPGEKINP